MTDSELFWCSIQEAYQNIRKWECYNYQGSFALFLFVHFNVSIWMGDRSYEQWRCVSKHTRGSVRGSYCNEASDIKTPIFPVTNDAFPFRQYYIKPFSKKTRPTRKSSLITVCLCVCVYTLPPVGFSRLHDICDIREKFRSTIFCCEYFWVLLPSFFIYLISPPKTRTPANRLLERKRYDMFGIRRKDDIYWYRK